MHKDDICITGGFLSLAYEFLECGTSRCVLVKRVKTMLLMAAILPGNL